MAHLEGYKFSQEGCSHIGKKHFADAPELYVNRDMQPRANSRLALLYDKAICEDCGQWLQLLWNRIEQPQCEHRDLFNWQRYFERETESIRGQCRDCGAWKFYHIILAEIGAPAKEWPINAE